MVFLEFNAFFGKGILFFMVTPLGPMLQRITHRFYSSNSMLHPFGMLVLLGEAIQVDIYLPLKLSFSVLMISAFRVFLFSSTIVGERHSHLES